VVVNVSRTVLDEAHARYAPVRVISIVADIPVLAARLAARGREDAETIAQRLARAGAVEVAGDDVVTVRNDSTLAEGVARMLAAIRCPPAP
jgi:phosphonate metabolism protein PhnN/1,5-bisphosphokinase (PRPP-forming)